MLIWRHNFQIFHFLLSTVAFKIKACQQKQHKVVFFHTTQLKGSHTKSWLTRPCKVKWPVDNVKYGCNEKMMQKVKKTPVFSFDVAVLWWNGFPLALITCSPTRELLMNIVTMGALPLCSKFADSLLVLNVILKIEKIQELFFVFVN